MPLETLGLIGGGHMAEGIVRAILSAGALPSEKIMVSDPEAARRTLFAPLHVGTTADNAEVARQCRTLLLAVKPQMFAQAAESLKGSVTGRHLLISIMAGVPTAKIEQAFASAGAVRVIRTMPNLAVLVREGMTGLAKGKYATDADLEAARTIFNAAGKSLVLNEDQLHAVTAVSGSGPAYYYYFTEAVVRGGLAAGLTEAEALQLAKQTALGAALMMTKSHELPAELRRKVTSKGGTTQAALETMDGLNVPAHIAQGVQAAWNRSKELGQG